MALLVFVLLPSVALAQVGPDAATRNALRWTGHEAVAGHLSDALALTALAQPCLRNRTWACARTEALRVGLGAGLQLAVKHVTHRTRPDGSDDLSFYSGHTALTCAVTLDQGWWATLCPAVAYLRIAADRHWLSDVAAGAAVGGGIAFSIRW